MEHRELKERFVRTPQGQTVRVMVCPHDFENPTKCPECNVQKNPEDALQMLAETDELTGSLEGQVRALEFLVKQRKSLAFLDCDGTIPEKEARTCLCPDVIEAQKKYVDAITEQKTLQARRKTAELTIAVWQTTSANTRRGNVS
jgi:hypothetical protein